MIESLTLSSHRASVRRPKQHWSCNKKLSYRPQEKKKKNLQIAHIVKRTFNKISNSENYGQMPAADGRRNYTPVHLVESVENCGLCMRHFLASSSYAHVMHCALAITRVIGYDASIKHWIMRNCKLPSLPLSCTGYNFYWLDEVNRSIIFIDSKWLPDWKGLRPWVSNFVALRIWFFYHCEFSKG